MSGQALEVLFVAGYAEGAAVGDGLLEEKTEIMARPSAAKALADKIWSTIDG